MSAPVGVADFGVTDRGAAYSYSSSRFLATANIRSLSTSGPPFDLYSLTFQLNVVIALSRGSSLAVYWIQDVPYLNTSTRQLGFLDNVWNMSSASSQNLNAQSVQGNGTIQSLGGNSAFYYDQPGTYPGNGVKLSYPSNVSVEVVASTISGLTRVGFLYNDGYGWVIFDNVTFPWTQGWSSSGFVVNGEITTPLGIYYDAEWVLGGPGGGSNTSARSANLSLDLERYNGHNFVTVPYAYDRGGDTAETINGVSDNLSAGPDLGAPGALLRAGTEFDAVLYSPADYAEINASGLSIVQASGTVDVNASSLDYVGGAANLSLMPGRYALALEPQKAHRVALALSAGEYIPTDGPWGQLNFSPMNGLPQATVSSSGSSSVVGAVYRISWVLGGNTLCTATASSGGAYSCSWSVPIVRAGSYVLLAANDSATAGTGLGSFAVTTNLTATVTANPTVADANASFDFAAATSGGWPPYGPYDWSFGDGMTQVTSLPDTSHAFATAGSYSVRVEGSDRLGNRAPATATVTVIADPKVPTPQPNRTAADIGQSVSFTASASQGIGSYTFNWSGLPPGCTGGQGVATCPSLTQAGTFLVAAIATDRSGYSVASAPYIFVVSPLPVATTISSPRGGTDVGEALNLTETVLGGSGGFVYLWQGTPTNCTGGEGPLIACTWSSEGSYTLSVKVTDSNLESSTSPMRTIRVSIAPTLSPVSANRPGVDVGQAVTFSTSGAGGSGGSRYTWSGLPAGCPGFDAASVSCVPTSPGSNLVTVVFNDSNADEVRSSVRFVVSPLLTIEPLNASAASTDVGHAVAISVAALGGAPNLGYEWSGLPPGCPALNDSIVVCTPTGSGSFNVSVTVTDENGGNATSPGLGLRVAPPLAALGLSVSPSAPLAGQGFSLTAGSSGGTGPIRVRWLGLPTDCTNSTLTVVTCPGQPAGSVALTAVLTDSVGSRANDSLQLSIAPTFLGLPELEGVLAVGAVIGAAALAVLGLISRAMREDLPPPRRPTSRSGPSAARPAGPDERARPAPATPGGARPPLRPYRGRPRPVASSEEPDSWSLSNGPGEL